MKVKLKNADVHVVTSLVKFFFRSLPDSLLTEELYASFVEGIGKILPIVLGLVC